ncbi:MAG: hypothetical protein ACRYG8_36540 [Janthinobacterium lividum]
MRRLSLKLTLPLTAAAVLLLLLPMARAAEPSAPPAFWPEEHGPAPVRVGAPEGAGVAGQGAVLRLPHEAPAAVKDAIAVLATACAVWTAAAPPAINGVASPFDVTGVPEEETCELVTQPERALSFALWSCGVLGGVVTIAGLIGFCFLRMVLVQMWSWRPRAATLPWS